MTYELVCGLETHVELSTKTKIFCSCRTDFGGDPNTHCCPICIGLPGTLPKLNSQVVKFAIMAGLATNCEINMTSKMDRKNYVYPDLPKAYQVSQYDLPLCKNGYIELEGNKKVRIARIHIEEDAGKLVHKGGALFIDYNRGGVPLIEIVTEPDIRSAAEAKEYVEKLQSIMRYIGISDCKMQEGSMRCDVNISVKPVNSQCLGTRTEIKNMNSVAFMVKAIEFEKKRQIILIENGQEVIQETLKYKEDTGTTESMRDKEDAQDYRYFKEPDLVTIKTTKSQIEDIKKEIPELPDVRLKRYIEKLDIPKNDAVLIIKYRKVAEFFEKAIKGIKKAKIVSNFIIGQIFRNIENESGKEEFNVSISAEDLNELALMVESGRINMNLAKSSLLKMLENGKKVSEVLLLEDMQSITEKDLELICNKIIKENKKATEDYKNGKEKALKALVGGVMRDTKGRANPELVRDLLNNLILET